MTPDLDWLALRRKVERSKRLTRAEAEALAKAAQHAYQCGALSYDDVMRVFDDIDRLARA